MDVLWKGGLARKGTTLAGLAILVVPMAVAGCGRTPSAATDGKGYTDVTVERLVEMLEAKDFASVNVDTPCEGEIPQTDLFFPFDEVSKHAEELPGKDAAVVLYCRGGSMSTTAAGTLASLGYANLREVDDGMRGWEAAGYELFLR